MKKVIQFFKDESGANMVEYALLTALIGVVLIATIGLMTGAIDTTFTTVTGQLNTASGS